MRLEGGWGAVVAGVAVEHVGPAREAGRAPGPDVVGAVGMDHRPAAARRLEPELEGRVGAAGRAGGELYRRSWRLRRGRAGHFGDSGANRPLGAHHNDGFPRSDVSQLTTAGRSNQLYYIAVDGCGGTA